MALSWKPVRRGETYCAPACGAGCTWAAHRQAKEDARELAAKLGDGWTPRVWESMGWHYQVTRGRIKVLPSELAGYVVIVSMPWILGTMQSGLNPVKLVRTAVREVSKKVGQLSKELEGLTAAVEEFARDI